MYVLFLILHVLISLVLIVVVLLQSGKGGGLAGAFGGGGGSQAIFGGRGAATFLSKATTYLGAGFFRHLHGAGGAEQRQAGRDGQECPRAAGRRGAAQRPARAGESGFRWAVRLA